jgi:hypothetical protein
MKAKRQEIIKQLRKLLADLEREAETKEKLCVDLGDIPPQNPKEERR